MSVTIKCLLPITLACVQKDVRSVVVPEIDQAGSSALRILEDGTS